MAGCDEGTYLGVTTERATQETFDLKPGLLVDHPARRSGPIEFETPEDFQVGFGPVDDVWLLVIMRD